jgi:DNA-binding Lrp family transcriptional regulator
MNRDTLGEIISSPARLAIMDAVSVRPRTLAELGSVTGISVQGVLRHLRRLAKLGVVKESRIVPKALKARVVYVASSAMVGNYSESDLIVVKSTDRAVPESKGPERKADLEALSGDLIVLRRRVREETRRLSRLIEEHVSSKETLNSALASAVLGPEERLILNVILTEETIEDGIKVLSKYYGLTDRRSIDRALTRARRFVHE